MSMSDCILQLERTSFRLVNVERMSSSLSLSMAVTISDDDAPPLPFPYNEEGFPKRGMQGV